MKSTVALVSAFPPNTGSLNEYGLHLARAFAENEDVKKVVIIADKGDTPFVELELGPKIEVRRVWRFNDPLSILHITSALRKARADVAVYNVQTATFGDRELPAALGLATPALTRFLGVPSGIIAHNIIEGIDLENTILSGNRLRQLLVKTGGYLVSRAMTLSNWFTTTLDAYANVYSRRFPKADVSVVPHGTFERPIENLPALTERPHRIVTMGKFGTYKKLDTLISGFLAYRALVGNEDAELVIGGTDHPNTPGYVESLRRRFDGHNGIRFAGYIAEAEVPSFFLNARAAVFDYTATTGSSGVLHQAASFGAIPIFPMLGDFVELCEREGLSGENYTANSPEELYLAMIRINEDMGRAEKISAQNFAAVHMFSIHDVAEFHLGKLRAYQKKGVSKMPTSDLRSTLRVGDTVLKG